MSSQGATFVWQQAPLAFPARKVVYRLQDCYIRSVVGALCAVIGQVRYAVQIFGDIEGEVEFDIRESCGECLKYAVLARLHWIHGRLI